MNIKRFITIGLALAFALSISCAAISYDAYYYQNEDGSYGHDTEMYEHDLALEMVNERGLSIDVSQYWTPDPHASELTYIFDFEAFRNDYNAIIEALPPVTVPTEPEEPPTEPEEDLEVLPDDSISEMPMDETVLEMDESDPILELGEDSPMVYLVNDMRNSGDVGDGFLVDGLKGVIRSVFGVYEPVTTTAAITETIDGETITTLVDVVADGAAGVDYEYISGVLLFGIMLFCLFKLLGGILS